MNVTRFINWSLRMPLIGAAVLLTAGAAFAAVNDNRKLLLIPPDITVGDVRTIVERQAAQARVKINEAEFQNLIKKLSDPANCDELGMLCALVGKERIPEVIGAGWAAGRRGANFEEMFNAIGAKVDQLVAQKSKEMQPQLAQLDSKMDEAIRTGRLDPNNAAAVQGFVKSNSSSALLSWASWLPSIDIGAGIKCQDQDRTEYYTKWGIKIPLYRRLKVCAGKIYGQVTMYIGGLVVNPGAIGLGTLSAHARTLCRCVPEAANQIKAELKFQSNPWATSQASNAWLTHKVNVYVFTGTIAQQARGQSLETDQGKTLDIGPIWFNF